MASFFGCIFPLTWLDMSKHWPPFLFASSVWLVWSEREHTNRKLDEMHETIKAILHHMTVVHSTDCSTGNSRSICSPRDRNRLRLLLSPRQVISSLSRPKQPWRIRNSCAITKKQTKFVRRAVPKDTRRRRKTFSRLLRSLSIHPPLHLIHVVKDHLRPLAQ